MAKKEKEKEIDVQFREFLDRKKDYHFNDISIKPYSISTGSLRLDAYLASSPEMPGIASGQIVNVFAEYGEGKTSFFLTAAKHHQQLGDDHFFVWINAEGRSRNLLEKYGIDTSNDKFFELRSNVAETVFEFTREVMQNNPKKRKYFILIDSLDSLTKCDDLKKIDEEGYDSNAKVAGNASLSKRFLKELSLGINAGQHILGICSQLISNIDANNPRAKKTLPAGGKGLSYFSSIVIEVLETWTGTVIWENPSAGKLVDKGKRLGHYFQPVLRKHPRDEVVGAPSPKIAIKHGVVGQNAIWEEFECFDILTEWSILRKETAQTFSLSEEFLKELKDNGLDIGTNSFRGEKKFVERLEENPEITKFILQKFKSIIFA